tara:strand:- start:3105 stop:3677 length:573 start_codon:yes stop_codon:yes gene_type:complete
MGEAVERASYDEYLRRLAASESKLEFVDGVIYAMTGGTPTHARLAASVTAALHRALAGSDCAVYSSDLAIRVEATNRTTFADAVVVCGPELASSSDPNAITNPSIVVEVLSPSTEASDRGEKFRHYQQLPSLREYVLVSQDEPRLEIFRRDGNAWILRSYGPGEHAELESQGVTLPIDELYADRRSSAAP